MNRPITKDCGERWRREWESSKPIPPNVARTTLSEQAGYHQSIGALPFIADVCGQVQPSASFECAASLKCVTRRNDPSAAGLDRTLSVHATNRRAPASGQDEVLTVFAVPNAS
jgi:hypothetical protein